MQKCKVPIAVQRIVRSFCQQVYVVTFCVGLMTRCSQWTS